MSFSTWVPRSSIRAASSTTGPRTSYNTLSSLDDFLNEYILESPVLFLLDCFDSLVTESDCFSLSVSETGFAEETPDAAEAVLRAELVS